MKTKQMYIFRYIYIYTINSCSHYEISVAMVGGFRTHVGIEAWELVRRFIPGILSIKYSGNEMH